MIKDKRVICHHTDGSGCPNCCSCLYEAFISYPAIPCATFQNCRSLSLETQAEQRKAADRQTAQRHWPDHHKAATELRQPEEKRTLPGESDARFPLLGRKPVQSFGLLFVLVLKEVQLLVCTYFSK